MLPQTTEKSQSTSSDFCEIFGWCACVRLATLGLLVISGWRMLHAGSICPPWGGRFVEILNEAPCPLVALVLFENLKLPSPEVAALVFFLPCHRHIKNEQMSLLIASFNYSRNECRGFFTLRWVQYLDVLTFRVPHNPDLLYSLTSSQFSIFP